MKSYQTNENNFYLEYVLICCFNFTYQPNARSFNTKCRNQYPSPTLDITPPTGPVTVYIEIPRPGLKVETSDADMVPDAVIVTRGAISRIKQTDTTPVLPILALRVPIFGAV
jgi:hypothetical protein